MPILQASPVVSAGPSWGDIAGPAGGFVAIVILLFFAGKGAYQLCVYGIDAARGFGGGVLQEWRRSNDEMRGWLISHANEEVAVMREIRDSLHRAAVDRERHTAELAAVVERAAKETRHSVRNELQALRAVVCPVASDDTDPPPARGRERD